MTSFGHAEAILHMLNRAPLTAEREAVSKSLTALVHVADAVTRLHLSWSVQTGQFDDPRIAELAAFEQTLWEQAHPGLPYSPALSSVLQLVGYTKVNVRHDTLETLYKRSRELRDTLQKGL